MGRAIDLQIPALLPALGEPEDPDFLDIVKENLQLWRSELGDPLDAVVTKRFLFEKGLIDVFIEGIPTSFEGDPIDPNLGQGGSIATGGITVETPTLPTTVVATAIALGAVITWDVPTFGGYKHTEVWRSNDNDLDNATLVGASSIGIFTDHVGLVGVTRYYWVRHINTNNVAGPYHAGQMAGEQITTLAGATLQQAYDAGSGAPQIVTTVADGPVTIQDNATPTGADLLAVRTNAAANIFHVDVLGAKAPLGIVGGDTGDLTLGGNRSASLGFINANSPIIFGPYSANPSAAYGFSYTAVEVISAAFIGGGLNFSGDITFSNPTFIYESYRGAPHITTATGLGFAAYTVLQALPLFTAGTLAGQNPLSQLIINAGATSESAFFGTMTVTNSFGLSFSPQTRALAAFAIMATTNQTAVSCRPTVSTVFLSTANVGNIRGLHQQNPIAALFQPNAGSNVMVSNVAVDVDNIFFGGNVTKAAVRSAQLAASNAYFLLQTGNAQNQLRGQTFIPLDLVGFTFGASNDTNMGWAGAGFFFQSFAVGQQWRLSAGTDFNRITNDNDSELQMGFSDVTIEGNLEFQGGLLANTTRVTTTYTILVTDYIVLGNTDGGAFTETLPAGVQNQTFRIINSGSSGNNLTLAPDGSEHLIGVNSNFVLTDGEVLEITYDTTDGWY